MCVHTKDRIAWLDQPKVIAMGTDDRTSGHTVWHSAAIVSRPRRGE